MANLAERLMNLSGRGFDECTAIRGGMVRVGCSQCAALVINGLPSHESGCPNETRECAECGIRIPKRQRVCEDCANPEPCEGEL